uniref:F-box domain-containing protein n=1 Tax=Kwoniella dejecticola CBS 10117 TaxID=1296121 RepID=A0A1A6AD48_9TREE|nr:uncharacterized protein I303_02208 [Kwoniella dejecticola CBS 10117]OBR87992.1 hypothetical protein I303_02208 [Kwoniella dejecticola CBS 10117]
MLDQIPSEIISQISYHLSLTTSSSFSASTSSSNTLEDIPPINLLLSCRTINEAINPTTNPRLYGKLFKALFDIDAPERRLRIHPNANAIARKLKKRPRKRRKTNEDDKLKAQELTKELKKRINCLLRLRDMIEQKDVSEIEDDDLWTIYFMLIENDGKNLEHLIGPKATIHLPALLELYHEQHFLAAAVEPGYPAETVGRSLAMWIAWLVGGSGAPDETPEQREERMFVLRPYVFAAQQYHLYFAPWTLPDLPLTKPLPPSDNSNPFVADLTPRSRSCAVEHFGRQLSVCPPFLAHAAILRFFYRRPGEDIDGESDNELDMVTPPFMTMQNAQGQGQGQGQGHAPAHHHHHHHGTHTPITNGVRVNDLQQQFLIGNSKNHDLDFARLKACHDPLSTKGLKSPRWKGCWDGCWEGTFSFFDFDAFREMLAGHARALYEGPYGEQAQVWRIKETYVRKIGWVKRPESLYSPHQSSDDEYYSTDENAQAEAGEEEGVVRDREGLPLNGPPVNAGFPLSDPPNTFANLASEIAEAETLKQTIKQQIQAIKGYEIVPPQELDQMLSLSDEEQEESGLEMLLSGTGHSAWGKFILKGRVRSWDGMASLVKEYAPDSRGKWIYRGYVLAGDIFVGRWRDTYTPENFVGYEGTFFLNRR